MRYQTARGIEAFEEARWDALAGDEIVLSHRFQSVMEASRRDYRPLYMLVEEMAWGRWLRSSLSGRTASGARARAGGTICCGA
jgi:hypothetical protein